MPQQKKHSTLSLAEHIRSQKKICTTTYIVYLYMLLVSYTKWIRTFTLCTKSAKPWPAHYTNVLATDLNCLARAGLRHRPTRGSSFQKLHAEQSQKNTPLCYSEICRQKPAMSVYVVWWGPSKYVSLGPLKSSPVIGMKSSEQITTTTMTRASQSATSVWVSYRNKVIAHCNTLVSETTGQPATSMWASDRHSDCPLQRRPTVQSDNWNESHLLRRWNVCAGTTSTEITITVTNGQH